MPRLLDITRNIFLIALLAPVLSPAAAAAAGLAGGGTPGVGSRLPALQLADMRGRVHTIEWGSSSPRATILFFFEARCTECVREMIFVESMLLRGRDFGLRALAIEGSGLAGPEVEASLERFRGIYGEPSFPVILDPDRELGVLFGVRRLPSSFLVQRHGVVLSRTEGFGEREAVDLAWKSERLLGVEVTFFSAALREIEIGAGEELALRASSQAAATRAGRARSGPPAPLRKGDEVPRFDFTDLRGGSHRWEPAPAERALTVVFFWGALCRPCIREMTFLDEVFLEARDLGLKVIAVEGSGLDAGRTALVIERYRRFHPAPSYPVVPDPEYRIARLFGVTGALPQTFLVDAAGRVVHRTDEFAEGHEAGLVRRFEKALVVEPGTLAPRPDSARGGAAAPAGDAEAPTVVADVGRKGEFRSNLVQGDTYYEQWRFDRALPHYLTCLEIDPRDVEVRARVARIYQRQGRLDLSLAHWLVLLEADPANAEARSSVESLRDQGVEAGGAI